MTTYVALLRGINVGGTGKLPMADLRTLLTGLGLERVATYIQSGNVVFDAGDGEWADPIALAIEVSAGFRPRLMIMTAERFRSIVAGNPFPTDEPKALHGYFLEGVPAWTAKAELEAARSAVERFYIGDGVVYLYTPEFLTGSQLAPKMERLLGVPATQRNWRTVERIVAMLDDR